MALRSDLLEQVIFASTDTPRDRFFLLGEVGRQLIAFWHPKNGLMGSIIEDDELADACEAYMRQHGYQSFETSAAVYEHAVRVGWPGWERFRPS